MSQLSSWIRTFAVSFPIFLTSGSFADPIELNSSTAYTRLRVTLDSAFSPKVMAKGKGFEIEIPGATLMDIGVPFGAESEFQGQIRQLKDSRVRNVRVKELSKSLLIQGDFVFPTGKEALAQEAMEHFEFKQGEQGRWVVDFWYSKSPTLVSQQLKQKEIELKKRKDQEQALLDKENQRKEARTKRLNDSKNAIQFCEQPVDRSNTVFLKFRPDHQRLNFSAYFPEHIPDHRFEYSQPRGESEEAQMVRLAVKLSRENKHALVVKTIDFFSKSYPKSVYSDEMKFLRASAFYRLGMIEEGKDQISKLSKSARGTEAGLQAAAFLAVQSFRNGEWLSALESFMNLRREFPKHPLIWLFRYGIAECLYEIKQSEQARVELEWVARNAPKEAIRAEAAFKLGDLYFDRNQFAQAIQSYTAELQRHSDYQQQYPSVRLNLAESYFQLEELQRAEQQYQKYLEIGRAQPNAWRAHLRLAEIKSIGKPAHPEAEAAYTETINRYPMTPGAVVARMRLLPCGSHGGFDVGSAERFFASPEVSRFDQTNELYTSSFSELAAITEVRTWISFKEDQKAVDRAMDHLRANPSFSVRKLIEQAMIGGIKRLLDRHTQAGDYVSALAVFEKYGDFLPLPNHDPMVDDLRLRLAKYASEMKFTNLALRIVEPYRRMSDIQQKDLLTAIEKNLTLESVIEQEERSFIEARTRWNGQTFKVDDEAGSNEFLTLLASIRDVSPHAWERDFMKALFFQAKKDSGKAFDFASKCLKKIGSYQPPTQAQLWAWHALLAQQAGFENEALASYRNARTLAQKLSQQPSEKSHSELNYIGFPLLPSLPALVAAEGEIMEKQSKWKEAVALYGTAIENKIGGNHVLYAHARAILKEGGRDSKTLASRSLQKIQQSQENDVWKNLAQKALDEIAKEGKNEQSTQSGNQP